MAASKSQVIVETSRVKSSSAGANRIAGTPAELRGPIGGYFVWTAAMSDPLCLIAAGSGIAPLMAMLRHRDRRNRRIPAVLLHSSRNLEDVIYRKELDAMARRDRDLRVVNTLTRKQPEGWTGYQRRIDKSMLADACFPPTEIRRYMSVAPLLSWKASQGFWSSLDMTLSRSRRSDSDPLEDEGND